jgi:hypothetical protein
MSSHWQLVKTLKNCTINGEHTPVVAIFEIMDATARFHLKSRGNRAPLVNPPSVNLGRILNRVRYEGADTYEVRNVVLLSNDTRKCTRTHPYRMKAQIYQQGKRKRSVRKK